METAGRRPALLQAVRTQTEAETDVEADADAEVEMETETDEGVAVEVDDAAFETPKKKCRTSWNSTTNTLTPITPHLTRNLIREHNQARSLHLCNKYDFND
uniref:Glycine--tRNA ligase 2, chloroplastic/mitochondrial n=1 Tax=Lygus hesperus TaxID=30085 RepID=A0A0A9WR84_LYGHE